MIKTNPDCQAIVEKINEALSAVGKAASDVAFLVADGAKVNAKVANTLINEDSATTTLQSSQQTSKKDYEKVVESMAQEMVISFASNDETATTSSDQEKSAPSAPALKTAIADFARSKAQVKPYPVACLAHYCHLIIKWTCNTAINYFDVLIPFKNYFTRLFWGVLASNATRNSSRDSKIIVMYFFSVCKISNNTLK